MPLGQLERIASAYGGRGGVADPWPAPLREAR